MINLLFNISNPFIPFRWSTIFEKDGSIPFTKRFYEIALVKSNTLIKFDLILQSTKNTSFHSTLVLNIGLLGYEFDFTIYGNLDVDCFT